MHLRFLLALPLSVAAVLYWTLPVASKDDGCDLGGERLVNKDGKKSKDISGIACTTDKGFPRYCLTIDDNMQAAQFVTVRDGELEGGDTTRPLIRNRYKDWPLELDGEGVAYGDDWFYVIGSHGHPRDKKKELDPVRDRDKIDARIAASSQVVRIRVRLLEGQPLTSADVVDITAGPYDVHWWDGSSNRLRHLADITRATGADEDHKPEAILPLDHNESGLRILVLSDGPKEGGPRDIVIPLP